jgi:osmotically-inducible protein OsmY
MHRPTAKPDTEYPVNGGGNEDGGFAEDIPWSEGETRSDQAPDHRPQFTADEGLETTRRLAEQRGELATADRQLADDLRSRLLQAGHVDATDITLDVRAGIVLLEGSVSDPALKRAAEDLMRGAIGVRGVENRLRVLPIDPGVGG